MTELENLIEKITDDINRMAEARDLKELDIAWAQARSNLWNLNSFVANKIYKENNKEK